MLDKVRNPSLKPVRLPDYFRPPEQYNDPRSRYYQSKSPERETLKQPASPSTDSQSKHFKFKFYNQYRKFIHKNRHIGRPHIKPPPKEEQKVQYLPTMKRDLSFSFSVHSGVEGVLDWMMEASALLKLTKNGFYRSLLIFYRISSADPRQLNRKMSHWACGSLSIGAKFQCSAGNHIESICNTNARRLSKQEIGWAEYQILETLKWQIPVDVLIEQELSETIRLWNDYLGCVEGAIVNPTFISKMLVNRLDNSPSKLYIDIVFTIDFLVTRRPHQFLKVNSFKRPILMALYTLTSISVGDVRLNQDYIWPLFQSFILFYKLLPADSLGRLKADLHRHFVDLRLWNVLGRIPLDLNFDRLLKKWNQQFYIPRMQPLLE